MSNRRSYDPMELEPDERSTRPEHENLREARRGRASLTPFTLVGGVAGVVALVASVLILAVVLIWIFV